jgi:hypothetical protein
MKTLKQDTCYTWDKLTVSLAEGESKARSDLAAHLHFFILMNLLVILNGSILRYCFGWTFQAFTFKIFSYLRCLVFSEAA